MHGAGLVIGDVNHGNLVVAEDGTVRLIDCDSFQVSRNGRIWLCPVGVGTHQPPEMQGISDYGTIVRAPNHDNFGLAVIIFQLLCIARHPFAGEYLGSGQPPAIPEAIAQSRYAYSRDRQRTRMAPPPGSLSMDALPQKIRDLFEAAFAPGASRGGRPTPDEWIRALHALGSELKQCSSNRGHYYWHQTPACPWCAIEAASGITLFPAIFVTAAGVAGGMVALWQEVLRVAEPPALPPPPDPGTIAVLPSGPARAAGRREQTLRVAAYTVMGLAFLTAIALAPPGAQLIFPGGLGLLLFLLVTIRPTARPREFKRRLDQVQREWATLRNMWSAPVPEPSFAQLRAKLDGLKAKHDALPSERARRLQKLSEQVRQKQFAEHLDRFPIAASQIPGIKKGKIATLSAYGIDTAGDIEQFRIMAIPGFGKASVAKLVKWRQLQEQSFSFDPRRGVSQTDVHKIEHEIAMERMKLEREVSAGLPLLKATAANAVTHHRLLEIKATELLPKLAQAVADAKAAPGNQTVHRRMLALGGTTLGVALLVNANNGHFEHRIRPLPAPPPVITSPTAPPASVRELTPPREVHASSQGASSAPAPSASPPPPSASPSFEEVITLQPTNVRSAPNGRASVVRIAPERTTLRIFGRSGGWVLVGDEVPWGWAYAKLLSKDH